MKLDGVRVLDLSSFLPGPYATLAMADHGADVVKIEAPGGDPGRHIGPADGDETVFFRNLNRGKKSVVLDLKTTDGLEALLRMVDAADVLVESFRPGVATRLGIDHGVLAARNPRLVYCSISAFGQDGPRSRVPAHDLAIEGVAGILGHNLGSDGRPALPAIPIADVVAGLQALAGIVMALLARERTGRGDRIDISMQECLVGAMLNVLGPTLAQGRQPDTPNERTTGGSAFYRLYDTADGRQLALAGQESKFVTALLSRLDRMDLAPLCFRGPGPHQRPVTEMLQRTFGALTLAQAAELLDGCDICWGAVKSMPEALADPQLAARGFLLSDVDGRRHVGPPVRFLDQPATPTLHAPRLDEHGGIAATLWN